MKSYAKSSKNRVNLPLSLAMKYALFQSYFYIMNENVKDIISYGPIKSKSSSAIQNFQKFYEILSIGLQNFKRKIKSVKWIEINGKRYTIKVTLSSRRTVKFAVRTTDLITGIYSHTVKPACTSRIWRVYRQTKWSFGLCAIPIRKPKKIRET